MFNYENLTNKPKINGTVVGNEKEENIIKTNPYSVAGAEAFYTKLIRDYSIKSIGLEEDNPFASIGDGWDNEEADDPSTAETGDNPGTDENTDNPFDSDSADPWGDDDADSGWNDESTDETNTVASPQLDRVEAIADKFNMSNIVRRDFPTYISQLESSIETSIEILNSRELSSDYDDVKAKAIASYRSVLTDIREYIIIIDGERYEDIFKMYLKFWSVLKTLKQISQKIMS